MTCTLEPFYRSSNGDRWSLVGKADGSVIVRHEANAPAGGAITETGLAEFLAREGHGPEHQILASLVSTMPDFQFLAQRTTAPLTGPAHASAGQFRRPTQRLSISSITVALFASMMARSGGICSVVS